MSPDKPCLLMAAPNGARRTRLDHPALPLTPAQLAEDASRCLAAGASALHFHVRDNDGRHSLDVGLYREALAALRAAVGNVPVLQVTSEAGGRYSAAAQRESITILAPEAISLAIREWFVDATEYAPSGILCQELSERGCALQYILYSPEDLERFRSLRRHGLLPRGPALLLFVLGRYGDPPEGHPEALSAFTEQCDSEDEWAVCAFGCREADCMAAAARLGGHARVGFENNLWRPTGELARDNAELVAITGERLVSAGRRPMTPDEARAFMGLTGIGRERTE